MIVFVLSTRGTVMTMGDEGAEYLLPQEVAHLLRVSPKTVNRWADRGWLACSVTLGGHRRYRRTDVEALAERMGPRARER
jgi:excisionase family DNA binding protein